MTYKFKVEALNSYGYSEESAVLEMLCAHVPDKVFVPSTSNIDDMIKVSWQEPSAHGSPILGYKILIRTSSFDFVYSDQVCDGTT